MIAHTSLRFEVHANIAILGNVTRMCSDEGVQGRFSGLHVGCMINYSSIPA